MRNCATPFLATVAIVSTAAAICLAAMAWHFGRQTASLEARFRPLEAVPTSQMAAQRSWLAYLPQPRLPEDRSCRLVFDAEALRLPDFPDRVKRELEYMRDRGDDYSGVTVAFQSPPADRTDVLE